MPLLWRLLLTAISLLTISSIRALAQQPEDIRVSPLDITTSRVPLQGRFQSAMTIKGNTLVAWGTSRRTPDDSLAYTIRYQIFNGSSPTIIERPLTLDRARPFGFAIVMPVERAFLVLWNDNRKDSSGIYMQPVAENGNFPNGEIRIGKGSIIPDSSVGIWGLPNRNGGSLLLWRDGSDNNLHGITINLNGQPMDSDHIVAKNMDRILAFDSLPRAYMLMNGNSGILVDAQSRTTPTANLNPPFYLGKDTSFLNIQGDTLQYYRSVFDSKPYKSLIVAAIDSGIPGMTAVRRRDSGITEIFFGRVSVTGTQISLGRVLVQFYRINIFPNDSIGKPVAVLADQWNNGSSIYSTESFSVSSFNGASVREGCSNTYRFKLNWTAVGYVHDHPQPASQYSTYYSIGGNGIVVKSDSAFLGNGYVDRQDKSIKRLDDTTASSVSIVLAGKNIVLHATSALLTSAVPRITPGLVISNNALVVTWEEPGKNFECRRWIPETGNPSQPISRLHVPAIEEPTLTQMQSIQKTLFRDDFLYNWPGMSGIRSAQSIEDYGIYYYTGASYGYERLSWSRISFFMATDAGWNTTLSLDDAFIPPPVAAPHSLYAAVNGYDPSSNQIFMRIWNNVADRSSLLTLRSVGPNGGGWRIDSLDSALKYGLAPIQAGEHRFMFYEDSIATIYNGNSISNQIRFSTIRPSFCLKSLGSQFIRLSWADSISTDFHIELYDFNGHRLRNQVIPRKTRDQFPLFFQNPRDFSWALYWIADSSVHITLLGSDLSVIVPDTVISSHGMKKNVSAVIRGDTVFAVWEDYRNGNADIYGNYLPIPLKTSTIRDRQNPNAVPGSNISVNATPNPARDLVTVTTSVPASSLAIVDALGAIIWNSNSTETDGIDNHITISTVDIPSGIYFLRCSAGKATGMTPLVITH